MVAAIYCPEIVQYYFMKLFYLLLLFSTTVLQATGQQPGYDDKAVKETLQKSADTMADLFMNGCFREYAEYIHPKIVQMMGGKDKMETFLKEQIRTMNGEGFVFKKVSIGPPGEVLVSQGELQTVIPQVIELANAEGILKTSSSLIAISTDQGKTWHFIDTGGKSLSELRKVFKSLRDDLVIPAKKPPVFQANE